MKKAGFFMTWLKFEQAAIDLCKACNLTIEVGHEKTSFFLFAYAKTKMQIGSRDCKADQRLCFHYRDSTFSLLPKSEISSLPPPESAPIVVQPGLCQT